MLDAYIYDSLRSPTGRYPGELAGLPPDDPPGEVITVVSPRGGANPELAVVLKRVN